jgi:hypothetical protein
MGLLLSRQFPSPFKLFGSTEDLLFRPDLAQRDLLNTLAAIAGKKAGFKSLGDAWRTRRQLVAA